MELFKLKVSKTPQNSFEIEYKSDSSVELVCLSCPKAVGEIVNRSDLQNILESDEIGGLDKIIKISIPSNVTCINPEAFVDCINLQEVEIKGEYDGIECFSRAGKWSVTMSIDSLDSLVEELKKGECRIEIHRPSGGRSWTDWN
jgi:hypothetical protein